MDGQRDSSGRERENFGALAMPYLIVVVAAALTVVTIMASIATTWRLREQIEAERQAEVDRVALVVAEQTARSFQSIDLVLRELQLSLPSFRTSTAEIPSVLSTRSVHELLTGRSTKLGQVRNLVLIGADGKLLNMSSKWPAPEMSLADREQFRRLRDDDRIECFISEPVVNKLDGSWTVYVARRMSDATGRFAGVVQAAIRLKDFEEFYSALSLGEGGAISLLRRDGLLLASFPVLPEEIGKARTLDGLEENSAGVRPGYDSHSYRATRAVASFPLVIQVALSRDVALRGWWRDAVVLLLGSLGAVAGVVLMLGALSRKIRGIRQSEALLAEQNTVLEGSRKLLLEAQRIGKLGHWTSGIDGEVLIWSPQLFEIAGLPTASEVSIHQVLSLVHPDDVTGLLRAKTKALDEGRKLTHQHRWVRPDGEVRWVRLEAGAQSNAEGSITGFFGIIQDITEQKEAEEEAEASNNRLHDAVDSMPHGFVLYDRDDRLLLANTRFGEMFPDLAALMRPGMRFEEILRAAVRNGLYDIPPIDQEDWVMRAVAWHRAGSTAIERRTKEGRWIQFLDHRTSDGGVAGVRADITTFKDIESALEQRLFDLEKAHGDLEIQKNALEAAAEKLTAAKEAAEAANRAKSDFLAIMSHEIRTPLSGMLGMIDLLCQTKLDGSQTRFADLARESADALLYVVNNILDFSKLEAERPEPEVIDFELRPLLESAIYLMDKGARDKGLRLDLECGSDVPTWLKGDPGRIRQVLLNLVSNAVKFTEAGEIKVCVGCEITDRRKIVLRVSVTDTGIGISPDVQGRLFNPFVQADTSISRSYGGSGLGLAICKQLCMAMAGDVGLESNVGLGSTFWFTVTCEAGVPELEEPAPATMPMGCDLRVLVAEDNPILGTLIVTLLRSRGCSVEVAVNGKLAASVARQRHFDVILMDIQMPEMDGISATLAIRGPGGLNATTPIVALTANALVGQKEKYLAAGMNAYVTKPINPTALFETIEDVVSRGVRVRGPQGNRQRGESLEAST